MWGQILKNVTLKCSFEKKHLAWRNKNWMCFEHVLASTQPCATQLSVRIATGVILPKETTVASTKVDNIRGHGRHWRSPAHIALQQNIMEKRKQMLARISPSP
jgi:hypothetical protein